MLVQCPHCGQTVEVSGFAADRDDYAVNRWYLQLGEIFM